VPVQKVLVEEPVQVARELYLALTVDRAFQGPAFIASPAGGVEIEEVAARETEKIFNEAVDIAVGLQPFQGRRLARALDLRGEQVRSAAQMMDSVYKLFMELDCSLAEINPLVVTADGRLLAVDAKISLEYDALFRHPNLTSLADPEQEEPLEVAASQARVSYVKLDGTVGCLVNGAGLAMATMDLVKYYGGEPANFLDIGGSSNPEKVVAALEIITADPNVQVILFNIFGGITRCDDVARGIVEATKRADIHAPILIRLTGTNAVEARAILAAEGFSAFTSMDDVVRAAVERAAA
jgi:succinyl-CoA synthetase beta subunit